MPLDYRSSKRKKSMESAISMERSRSRRRVARWITASIILLLLSLVMSFREVLFPFLVGGIIAYILGPLVEKAVAKGAPRVLAGFGILTFVFCSATFFLYSFFPQFSEEGQAGVVRIQQFLDDAPELYEVFEGEVQVWVEGGKAAEDDGTADTIALSPPQPPEELLDSLTKEDPNRALAQVLLEPFEDGSYGISIQDSSFDIETSGSGGFRLTPVRKFDERATLSALRQDLVANLRNTVEGFGAKVMKEFVVLVRSLITGLLGAMVGIMLTFMVAGFLLLEMPHIRDASRNLVPGKYQRDYEELLSGLNQGLSGVVRGQILICLVNGVLSFIGFLIFIPKYAFVMAMLAGVMSLIPIFGTIISSIPVVLVGLTVSFGTAVGVLAWILGIHFIEGNFLNPKIIGTAAKINPVIIIFVLVAGEHTFGIPGALLAVPVTSVVLTLVGFTYSRVRPHLFST